MTDLNVVPFTNRMSEAELDEALKRVAETYGGNRREAGNRYEQELAKVFLHSGWSQEQLAKKVGVGPQHISYQIKFGQFLDYSATAEHSDFALSKLSEYRFRTYWKQTDKREANDRIRFRAVLNLIEAKAKADADPNAPQPAKAPRDLAKDIAAGQFADGKWHDLAKLQEAFDETKEIVDAALDNIASSKSHKCKLERKPAGNSYRFRIFRQHDAVSVVELVEKLSPIIDELKKLGGRDRARYSPLQITGTAMQLQNLLDEWRQ